MLSPQGLLDLYQFQSEDAEEEDHTESLIQCRGIER